MYLSALELRTDEGQKTERIPSFQTQGAHRPTRVGKELNLQYSGLHLDSTYDQSHPIYPNQKQCFSHDKCDSWYVTMWHDGILSPQRLPFRHSAGISCRVLHLRAYSREHTASPTHHGRASICEKTPPIKGKRLTASCDHCVSPVAATPMLAFGLSLFLRPTALKIFSHSPII